MALFTSTDAKIFLPRNIADGIVEKTQSTSVVARLSGAEPQRFGQTDYIVFDDQPRAEFVEEGGEKASTGGKFSSVTALPHKAQVTMRFNEEVQWADEDYQTDILKTLGAAGQKSLSRALDFGVIHRVNPLTGNEIDAWTNYIRASTLAAHYDPEQEEAEPDAAFREAAGLIIATGWPVTGAAFDPKLSWALSSLTRRDGSGYTSDLRYPALGLGTDVTAFSGVTVAQGTTVSGTPEMADSKVRGIIGDFSSGIRWGVQRQLPVELIRFGDPDGQGDLKRKNQIALRLEVVFGWYVFTDRFAIIDEQTLPVTEPETDPGTEGE